MDKWLECITERRKEGKRGRQKGRKEGRKEGRKGGRRRGQEGIEGKTLPQFLPPLDVESFKRIEG